MDVELIPQPAKRGVLQGVWRELTRKQTTGERTGELLLRPVEILDGEHDFLVARRGWVARAAAGAQKIWNTNWPPDEKVPTGPSGEIKGSLRRSSTRRSQPGAGWRPWLRPAWGPPYRQTERYASNCVPGPTHGPARWEPYRCSYRRGRASSRQEGATGAGKRQKRTGSALVAEISSRCRGLQRSALRFRTESGGTRKKAFIHCPLTPADPGNTLKWSDLGLTILEIYDD